MANHIIHPDKFSDCISRFILPKPHYIIPVLFIIINMEIYCAPSARYSSGYDEPVTAPDRGTDNEVFYGEASYYAEDFHGRTTANGEIFDMYQISAAHKTLPFNTLVRVTNLENQKSVVVRINDRGPYRKGRVLDLSYQAAKELDMLSSGVIRIKAQIVKMGDM